MLIENNTFVASLIRSKSANVLSFNGSDSVSVKQNTDFVQNDDLLQILYISVALLDSNIDNEFLLAINLLDKV